MGARNGRSIATVAAVALLLWACAAPVASPKRSEAPATQAPALSTSSAMPKFDPIGRFALSPAEGPWGTEVTAMAQGLAPRTAYDLLWSTVEGAWALSADRSEYIGRTFTPVDRKLLAATTDASGAFTATFRVPNDFGYQHDVLVKKGSETVNKSGFDVTMVTTINPASGPVGTPITVEVKGIGYRSYQNSFQLSYDNK